MTKPTITQPYRSRGETLSVGPRRRLMAQQQLGLEYRRDDCRKRQGVGGPPKPGDLNDPVVQPVSQMEIPGLEKQPYHDRTTDHPKKPGTVTEDQRLAGLQAVDRPDHRDEGPPGE